MSGGAGAGHRGFRLAAFAERLRVRDRVARLVVEGGAVPASPAFCRRTCAAVTAEVRGRSLQGSRYRTTGHGGEGLELR